MAFAREEVIVPEYLRGAVSQAGNTSSPAIRRAIALAEVGAGSPSGADLASFSEPVSPGTAPAAPRDTRLSARTPIARFLAVTSVTTAPPAVEMAVEMAPVAPLARPAAPQSPAIPMAPTARMTPIKPTAVTSTRAPQAAPASPAPKAALPKRLASPGQEPVSLRQASLIHQSPWGLDQLALWLAESSTSARDAQAYSGHSIRRYLPAELDADALLGSSQDFQDAVAEFVTRQTRSSRLLSSQAEESLRARVDEAMAGSRHLIDTCPPSVKRAVPAFLATTVVTAALMFNGAQSGVAHAEFAAQAERGVEATASRNQIAVDPAQVAPTTTAVPVAPPVVPVAAVAPAPAPAPAPPPPREWVSPLASPRLTSGFGGRVHPITKRYTGHEGIDYAAPTGTPIYAATGGKVVFAGREGGYGNYTCIAKDAVIKTCYGHQSKISVKVGQTVTAGQIIGAVGNTGNSTGAHLHFEVRVNGTPVNPTKYV